ncbi:MAG: hypothetical protein ACI9XU_002019, partial [Arenicella sp.]
MKLDRYQCGIQFMISYRNARYGQKTS